MTATASWRLSWLAWSLALLPFLPVLLPVALWLARPMGWTAAEQADPWRRSLQRSLLLVMIAIGGLVLGLKSLALADDHLSLSAVLSAEEPPLVLLPGLILILGWLSLRAVAALGAFGSGRPSAEVPPPPPGLRLGLHWQRREAQALTGADGRRLILRLYALALAGAGLHLLAQLLGAATGLGGLLSHHPTTAGLMLLAGPAASPLAVALILAFVRVGPQEGWSFGHAGWILRSAALAGLLGLALWVVFLPVTLGAKALLLLPQAWAAWEQAGAPLAAEWLAMLFGKLFLLVRLASGLTLALEGSTIPDWRRTGILAGGPGSGAAKPVQAG